MHFHHDRADIIKLFLINPPKNRVSKLSISFCTANPCPQTVPVIFLTTKKNGLKRPSFQIIPCKIYSSLSTFV